MAMWFIGLGFFKYRILKHSNIFFVVYGIKAIICFVLLCHYYNDFFVCLLIFTITCHFHLSSKISFQLEKTWSITALLLQRNKTWLFFSPLPIKSPWFSNPLFSISTRRRTRTITHNHSQANPSNKKKLSWLLTRSLVAIYHKNKKTTLFKKIEKKSDRDLIRFAIASYVNAI